MLSGACSDRSDLLSIFYNTVLDQCTKVTLQIKIESMFLRIEAKIHFENIYEENLNLFETFRMFYYVPKNNFSFIFGCLPSWVRVLVFQSGIFGVANIQILFVYK